MKSKDKVINKLSKNSLLEDYRSDRKILEVIEKHLKTVSVPKGTKLISEGEIGKEMFILLAGSVTISKTSRTGDSYTVASFSAEANFCFGEMGLVGREKRSATVSALEDSEFLVISQDSFNRLASKYPSVGFNIAKKIALQLSMRLQKTTKDMLTLFDALIYEVQES